MAVNIQPLADRVLVQPIEEKEVKKGGIIIPDTAKEKPQEAKVIALGTGKLDDDGKKIAFTVNWPMPGHANTCSVRNAPPSSTPVRGRGRPARRSFHSAAERSSG